MKTILTLSLVLLLVVSIGGAAAAAPKDDVLAAINATGADATFKVQAENFLRAYTLVQAQADVIIPEIQRVDAIAGPKEYKTENLAPEEKAEILEAVATALAALDMTFSYEKNSDGSASAVVSDEGGTVLASFRIADNQVSRTGFDSTLLLVALGVMLLGGVSGLAFRSRVRTRA